MPFNIIQVARLDGTALELKVGQSWDWTVLNLKVRLKKEWGIPPREQRIVAGAAELHDDALVNDLCSGSSGTTSLTLLRRSPEQALWLSRAGREPLQLRGAPQDIRADAEVVLRAVQADWRALEFAAPELKAERGVVMAAVEQDGLALQQAPAELRADREVVLAAVQQNGLALQFADDRLRGDEEVVRAAAQQDGAALRFAKVLGAPQQSLQPGDVVSANFVNEHWFLATIEQDNGDGTYTLAWFDGDTRHRVKRSAELKPMCFNMELERYEEVRSQ
mmetsp:Transcript_92712/g.288601  ORF Transcript_92712/g.288601 Transcript_92712/m.288601 type:complete len:277 (+) Transcript_92712:35-865(+)